MGASDWTRGAAKWGAAILLGGASLAGMAWSLSGQRVARVRDGGGQVVRSSGEAREPVKGSRTPATPSAKLVDTSAPPTDPPAADEPLQPAGSPQGSAPAIGAGTHRVNLNTATQAELELLPGIGPAMAKRIMEYRKEHGKFASVDQLDNVRGIGEKTLEKLRALVTVE